MAAGVVVIESHGLLHARLKASPAGADRGLEFASGHQLDPISPQLVPANMIGRFLDDGDLQKLHRMLIEKKPPAPSVRRRTAAKRRVGKSRPADAFLAGSRCGRGFNIPHHLTVFNRPSARVRFLGGKRRSFKVPVII
jgi:hypothetical protein